MRKSGNGIPNELLFPEMRVEEGVQRRCNREVLSHRSLSSSLRYLGSQLHDLVKQSRALWAWNQGCGEGRVRTARLYHAWILVAIRVHFRRTGVETGGMKKGCPREQEGDGMTCRMWAFR